MRALIIRGFATLLWIAACGGSTPPVHENPRVADAARFTDAFARSRRAGWDVRARAVGRDCDVLLIETKVILEDSLIDAIHYGAGENTVMPGGVYRFCRDHEFRAAAYKDRSGRIWAYGGITASEAARMEPCG